MDHPSVMKPVDAIVQAARERRLVAFGGAGVSMLAPSRAPSWWEIYAAAAEALGERFREGFPAIAPELDIASLLAPLQTQQLSDLIVARFAGDRFVEILQVVDVADPNENHVLLASLAAIGALRAIVTTNFDTLIERAAAVRGAPFAVVRPFSALPASFGTRPPLIKIHGSAVDAARLIETSSDKAREIDATLRDAWTLALDGADLLVLGYSGADLGFGAASRFFRDFLASGGRIWWLHLPGQAPALPDDVRARTTLMEGTLPEFLREVAAAAGAAGFATPIAGADAQRALRTAMTAWSRAPHIGRWAAAVFFLSLVRAGDRGAVGDAGAAGDSGAAGDAEAAGDRKERRVALRASLMQVARDTAATLTPGSPIDLLEMASAGSFLSVFLTDALQHADVEAALALSRAVVTIYESMDKALSGPRGERSARERHMNLSSAWNNHAHALMFSPRADEALPAFMNALRHAYLGGVTNSFLITLGNVVHFGVDAIGIRRGMQLAEGGITVADREGSVQASIELRLQLAGFHAGRNEIWAAARELAEARRLALAIHERSRLVMLAILDAHLLLRRGRMREGLTAIAAALEGAGARTLFVMRPVNAVWRYVAVLAGREEDDAWRLDVEDLDPIVARAEAEMAAARADTRLPWGGKLCRLQESACIGDDDAGVLFQIGTRELLGAPVHAAEKGLELAKQLQTRGYPRESAWAAGNVLANPHAQPLQRALAHALLAHAHAEMGRLETVDTHLAEAKRIYDGLGEPLPLGAALVGLWHAIQSGDVAKAVDWARQFVASVIDVSKAGSLCAETAAQIDSWGAAMAPVAAALREAMTSRFTWAPAPPSSGSPLEPFRRFVGTNAELMAAYRPGPAETLAAARDLLSTQDAKGALAVIDALETSEPDGLPEHLAGLAAALRIEALSVDVAPAEVDAGMDRTRGRLLGQLAFSALARVEATMVRALVSTGDAPRAAAIIAGRGFIAELAADPRAAASLRFWQAQLPAPRAGWSASGARSRLARRAVRYYDTAERLLLHEAAGAPLLARPSAELSRALSAYMDALKASPGPVEADAALARVIAEADAQSALTPALAAQVRGDRANWSLRARRYDEAVDQFRAVERELRAAGELPDALNAMAGQARAFGRGGQHGEAVATFARAIAEAAGLPIQANLLTGLAGAHVIAATKDDDAVDGALIDKAIAVYREALEASSIDDEQRAASRLGLARAHGEKGEQEAALRQLDLAIAELAHLGSALATTLLTHRDQFVRGAWRSLGLA